MAGKDHEPAQTDWEDEGGTSPPEPKQRTSKGLEIPVPKRREVMDAFKKIAGRPKRPQG